MILISKGKVGVAGDGDQFAEVQYLKRQGWDPLIK
jgi:hypothetical protein